MAVGISGNALSIITKLMHGKLDSVFVLTTLYILSGMSSAVLFMLDLELNHLTLPADRESWVYVIVHCAGQVIAVFTHFAAMHFGSPTSVAIALSSEILMRMICQYVLFPDLQPLKGGMGDIIGSILITIGIIVSHVRFQPSWFCGQGNNNEAGKKLIP